MVKVNHSPKPWRKAVEADCMYNHTLGSSRGSRAALGISWIAAQSQNESRVPDPPATIPRYRFMGRPSFRPESYPAAGKVLGFLA